MNDLERDFQDFWSGNPDRGWKRYPRRAKYPVTLKAYIQARDFAGHEEIMNGLQAALTAEYMDRIHAKEVSYIPHSYNWLNNRQWLDHDGEDMGALSQDQIEYWHQKMAEDPDLVPESIKKLLPPTLRLVGKPF